MSYSNFKPESVAEAVAGFAVPSDWAEANLGTISGRLIKMQAIMFKNVLWKTFLKINLFLSDFNNQAQLVNQIKFLFIKTAWGFSLLPILNLTLVLSSEGELYIYFSFLYWFVFNKCSHGLSVCCSSLNWIEFDKVLAAETFQECEYFCGLLFSKAPFNHAAFQLWCDPR